jgi:hypothetical protein
MEFYINCRSKVYLAAETFGPKKKACSKFRDAKIYIVTLVQTWARAEPEKESRRAIEPCAIVQTTWASTRAHGPCSA